jgi:hypothetical protein
MVKYDLSSGKLDAKYTELDYLYDLTKGKGIRQGDVIRFVNEIECTIEFHPSDLAIFMSGISSLKPYTSPSKYCTEYDYKDVKKRGGVATDFHKIASELFVVDAEGVLKHGDILNFSMNMYTNAYFVNIDSVKGIFKLYKNDDPKGYAMIPLQISSRVDDVTGYFMFILGDNNIYVNIEIDPSDKIIDALFHPTLLKKYRKKMRILCNYYDLSIECNGFKRNFGYHELIQNIETSNEMWRNLPVMTSDDSIYESPEYKELYENRKKTFINVDVMDKIIDFNFRFKAFQEMAANGKKKSPKNKSPKNKSQTVQTVTFDKRVLAHRVLDLAKTKSVKITAVNVTFEGDADGMVQQIEGMDFAIEGARDFKHKCTEGKVLNPETCNFIDANGALAKKLGLVGKVKKAVKKTKESSSSKKKIDVDGKVILFSGFRDAKLEADVNAAGGRVKNNYAKDVTFVVASNVDGTAAKLEKARADGKKIVSKDSFLKKFYA